MSSFKWVWARLSAKWVYPVIVLLLLVEALTSLSSIGIQKWVIDDVLLGGMYDKLPIVLGLFALVVLLDAVLFTFVRTLIFKCKANIRMQFIAHFIDRYHRISMDAYKNRKNVKLIHTMTKDVDGVANAFAQRIPEGIQTMVKTGILIGAVGFASPYLLLFVAVISPVYILLGKVFAAKTKPLSKEKSERRAELLAHMEEGISFTREVLAFNRQHWEQKRLHRLFHDYDQVSMEESRLNNRQMMMTGPLRWGLNLLVLAVLGYEVLQHSLSVGTFVVIYQFAVQLLDSIGETYGFVVGLSGSLASIERYREAIGFELIPSGSRKLDGPVKCIQYESVWFQYGPDTPLVLEEITLPIPIGQTMALVGASGGGKSTIVQLLIRGFEPTGGRIVVNGIPLDQVDREEWQSKVSIVFQEPYLFPDTIRSNIAMGRSVSDEALEAACRAAQIYDTIMALPDGFSSLIGERGMTLSGGQRQRIALARALAVDPDILILDEATSALDADTERKILHRLSELRKGKTTIIVAHRPTAIENADILYVLERGG